MSPQPTELITCASAKSACIRANRDAAVDRTARLERHGGMAFPSHSTGRSTRNPILFDALPGAELNRAPLPAIQNLVLLLHDRIGHGRDQVGQFAG